MLGPRGLSRVTPSSGAADQSPRLPSHSGDYWFVADADLRDEHLRRLLRCKYDRSALPPTGMFIPYMPELANLLCMPRDQVQGRLHNVVSGVAMVYGLVFSGVAGSALSPFDVKGFDEDTTKRTLANFYNFAASLQFVICVVSTLCTTYLIMEVNFEPDSTIFRCVAQFNFFNLYTMLIFWSTLLLLSQLCAVIYIHSDPVWAWTSIGAAIFILYSLLHHWAMGMKKGFPTSMLHYFPTLALMGVFPQWMFGDAWKTHIEMAHHLAKVNFSNQCTLKFVVLYFFLKHLHIYTLSIFNPQVKLQGAENNFGAAVVNKVRHDVANEQAAPAAGAEAYEDAQARRSSAQVDVKSDQGLAIDDMLLAALVPFLFQKQTKASVA